MILVGVALLAANVNASPPATAETAVAESCSRLLGPNPAADVESQIATYTVLIDNHEALMDAYFCRGSAHYNRGEYALARVDFKQVLALDPENIWALNNLGINDVKSGRVGDGLSELRQAIAVNPDFTVAYNNLGKSLLLAGRPADAIRNYNLAYKHWNAALDRKSLLYAILLGRAEVRQNRGDYKQALPDYDEAIALLPTRSDAYFDRGAARYGLKQYDLAIADFEEAIRLGAGDRAVLMKARALGDNGQVEAALPVFSQVLTANPRNVEALQNRCITKAKRPSLLDSALADCDAAVQASSGGVEANLDRGLVYYRLGRYDDAITAANAVLAQQPRFGRALFLRGVALRRKGDRAAGDRDIAAAEAINRNIPSDAKPYGLIP